MSIFDKEKCGKALTAIGVSSMLLLSSTAYAASPLLRVGSRGNEVRQLQQHLKEANVYNYRVTGYYGNITRDAVMKFQRQRGLAVDGIAGKRTLSALNGTYKSTSTQGTSSRLLRRGSRGSDVKDLQQRLKSKGYHKYSVDGIFGFRTEQSVKNFQKANGLVADGIVGSATMEKLKSSNSSRGGSSNKSSVEMLHWSTVRSLFPRGSTITVTDVDTGKSFKVYRMGGTNHADVEPLTAKDTAIMRSIYGSWSWTRRAIVADCGGRKIAASMNGMPHGQQTIYNNNFNGQFCIHFLGSKTHGSGRVDPDHQAAVRKAAR